jgi:hypothetical protein
MAGAKNDYVFQWDIDPALWQHEVDNAFAGKKLGWEEKTKTHGKGWWLLKGDCPHCGDRMGQLFDWGGEVVPAATVARLGGPAETIRADGAADAVPGGAEPAGPVKEISIEIVCNCIEVHDPHVPLLYPGCGYGKGIKVLVPDPRSSGQKDSSLSDPGAAGGEA